jgi:AcrR family transcriptional regulator
VTGRAARVDPAKRRGRPPDRDSADTRRLIIDASREQFARHGFDATSLAAVASACGLATSALYHYVGNKVELYEAVMVDTVDEVWSRLLEAVSAPGTLADQVDAFLAEADAVGRDDRPLSAFLVAVPVESRRNRDFLPLLDRLNDWEDRVFTAMARRGVEGGQLARFDSVEEAATAIRMVLVGWSWETHYQPQYRLPRAGVVRKLVAALAG